MLTEGTSTNEVGSTTTFIAQTDVTQLFYMNTILIVVATVLTLDFLRRLFAKQTSY